MTVTSLMRVAGAATLAASLTIAQVRAQSPGERANGYFGLIDEVEANILTHPEFLDALQEQNANNSVEDAKRLHTAWREMDQRVTWPIMSNPLSLDLRGMLVYYDGMISSITVLDDVGGVVAAWPKPLRYWQGDQPVFQRTYGDRGAGEFVDRVSREWVTGSLEQHIAKTLRLRGKRIGAISIGIDIEKFSTRPRRDR